MSCRKYRPSNGTEGMGFIGLFCDNCINENPHPDNKPKCGILSASMLYDLRDEKYPCEWCYGEDDKPTCTAFVKWDWGNDGDPNDPDNPKAPVPEDPNQLCFPFILDEYEINIKEITVEQTEDDRKNKQATVHADFVIEKK